MNGNLGKKVLVFCSLSFVPLGVSLEAQDTAENRVPTYIQEYREIWSASQKELDVKRVRELANSLSSTDKDTRNVSMKELSAIYGLDYGYYAKYGTKDAPDIERKKSEIWHTFAVNLDIAVGEKVHHLLEIRTKENGVQIRDATCFLGERSPHPGFLPLLRAIVKNQQEDFDVRYWALTSVSQIAHNDVVPFLIEQLDGDLAGRACNRLSLLIESGINREKGEPDWKGVKQRYEVWWQANKDKWKYTHSCRTIAMYNH